VDAGSQLVLDMRRFYSPGDERGMTLSVPQGTSGQYTAVYDPAKLSLALSIDKNAAGLIAIPLRATAEADDHTTQGDKSALEGLLLLGVQHPTGHTFRYRREGGQPTKVTVAGQFNGWNTQSHELKPTSDGSFELFVPLSPGSHEYKLVIDGVWTLDPANPDKATDGSGSENSVVRVDDAGRGNAPVVFTKSVENGCAVFQIVPGDSGVETVSAVLQLPGGNSRVTPHKLEGDTVSVEVPDAPKGAWVRVVVADQKGNVSNAARAPLQPLEGFQWQDGIIYYAFTDRFANGEKANDHPVQDERVLPAANYQGGDFQGIRAKIEEGYFEKLGINLLWLAPVNRNPDGAWQEYLPPYRFYTGYHGYWPVSHDEVEPRLGGEASLKEMIGAAHKKNMHIIADLVLKFVHVEHPLHKQHPDYFGSIDLPNGTKNLRLWDEHQFTTWFEEWLPAFDFSNPGAAKFLIGNAVTAAKRFDLDGYRLDAVKHIDRPFWARYRTEIRGDVDAGRKLPMYNVGETFMDRAGIMSFVGPNMLDGQFDFPLYDTIIDVFAKGTSGLQELEKSLSASERIYGKETLMSPLLGNHDKARFMAYADGDLPDAKIPDEEELGWEKPPKVDDPASYAKLKLGLTFILSVDGLPMIYYGDEIGMSGAGDPDNRRMMRWENLSPGELSVREHFSKAAAARRAHPALRYGSRRPLVAEGDRYAFVRAHLGDAVLAVWNRGGSDGEFDLSVGPEMPDGSYRDAFSGRTIEVKGGRTKFKLEPMSSALFTSA
ncbi:MAG: alpha-amylase family glycosyl hydrolase, partial [Verrucomicrobiota bacterium]